MAGDWIKMRVSLATHPKVLRLAECLLENADYLEWSALSFALPGFPPPSEDDSRKERFAALRVTRYVTVCSLLRFWGYANEHIKGDECIYGLWPDDVDEIAGVPGFCDAMQAIGWLEFDPSNGIARLPNFNEYNVVAGSRGKTNAERQKEYRERKKALAVTENVTTDRYNASNVTSNAREEKRRVNIRANSFDAVAYLASKGVPAQTASDWLDFRRAKKAKVTSTAIAGIEREAAKVGYSLADALALCCARGWQGFDASWVKSRPAPDAPLMAAV